MKRGIWAAIAAIGLISSPFTGFALEYQVSEQTPTEQQVMVKCEDIVKEQPVEKEIDKTGTDVKEVDSAHPAMDSSSHY